METKSVDCFLSYPFFAKFVDLCSILIWWVLGKKELEAGWARPGDGMWNTVYLKLEWFGVNWIELGWRMDGWIDG